MFIFAGASKLTEARKTKVKVNGPTDSNQGTFSSFGDGVFALLQFGFLEVVAFPQGDVNEAADEAPKKAASECEQGKGESGGGGDTERWGGEHEDKKVFTNAEAA